MTKPGVKLVKKGGPEQVNTALQRPPLIFPDTAYPLSALRDVRPGQYVGIGVQVNGKFQWRSYSVSSPPKRRGPTRKRWTR